jgi:aubergine-like protein
LSQNGVVKNVPAGTIVSESIVSNNYDFFMVSQYANRGSTIPNHYRVIYTDSKMQEDVLQELIYNQCFNYVNWTGSIKIPGILQYARKCTKFNTEVLEKKKISEELENKLYFI